MCVSEGYIVENVAVAKERIPKKISEKHISSVPIESFYKYAKYHEAFISVDKVKLNVHFRNYAIF